MIHDNVQMLENQKQSYGRGYSVEWPDLVGYRPLTGPHCHSALAHTVWSNPPSPFSYPRLSYAPQHSCLLPSIKRLHTATGLDGQTRQSTPWILSRIYRLTNSLHHLHTPPPRTHNAIPLFFMCMFIVLRVNASTPCIFLDI